MTFAMRCPHVVMLGVVIVFATARVAYSQVPKAEDIAACNMEAQRAVKQGAGSRESPAATAKDHSRAAEARGTEARAQNAGDGAKSEDPQLAGIDTEGAKDPAYQAAYRTCMRKAGF
jgi:hypothetical protein